VGADVVRTYLMFIGPWEGGGPWNSRGIEGVQRFLQRAWTLVHDGPGADRAVPAPGPAGRRPADRDLRHWTHKTIKKVTEDLEGFQFNTAISAMMEFANFLQRARDGMEGTPAWADATRTLVLLLAPFAPHLSEELWEHLGGPYSVHQQRWPSYDAEAAQAEMITLVLQVDGKVRDRIQVSTDLGEGEARELALRNEKVKRFMDGRSVADVVVVPRRLVNVVTREAGQAGPGGR
jgi:leucyl-tRNA synthetase